MANAYTDSNGVFKNLLGQTDAQALHVAEYGFTTARSIEILGGHVQLEVSGFGLQRLAAIHRHLFKTFMSGRGKSAQFHPPSALSWAALPVLQSLMPS